LDTRTKIVEPGSIPRDRSVRILLCYLDPVWGREVHTLRQHADANATMVIAVADPPDPLLPLRARAELAAALSFVDYVITEPPSLPDAELIDLRDHDLACRQSLIRHVLRRHRSE
jgi:hypothetical protein